MNGLMRGQSLSVLIYTASFLSCHDRHTIRERRIIRLFYSSFRSIKKDVLLFLNQLNSSHN